MIHICFVVVLLSLRAALESAKANVQRNKLESCIELKLATRRDYCK